MPGPESQAATDLLAAGGFGAQARIHGQLVFQALEGIDAPAVEAYVTEFQVLQQIHVESVQEADIAD